MERLAAGMNASGRAASGNEMRFEMTGPAIPPVGRLSKGGCPATLLLENARG